MKRVLLLFGWLLTLMLPLRAHDTSVLVVRFQELGDER